jgi:hypothetical protein
MAIARAPIFDLIKRTATAPAGHAEPAFDFLNRIAGDYWVHPRQLLQTWADRIADSSDYQELRQRFRSRDDEEFRSAFLELYLHECLVRAGYSVTIHPRVPNGSRRPDFLAERGDERFYLEAKSPGTAPAAKAAARRQAVLLDVVDSLGDPNFLLHAGVPAASRALWKHPDPLHRLAENLAWIHRMGF